MSWQVDLGASLMEASPGKTGAALRQIMIVSTTSGFSQRRRLPRRRDGPNLTAWRAVPGSRGRLVYPNLEEEILRA